MKRMYPSYLMTVMCRPFGFYCIGAIFIDPVAGMADGNYRVHKL